MPIFEVQSDRLTSLRRKSLSEALLQERRDLQRLLREHLPELIEELLIIAEEFCEWDDSRRRIDLLAVDKLANLVVIELKRGDTGTHMELQAVRYAAMVSTMTFEQAVSAFAKHPGIGGEANAREQLLAFLGWAEPNEEEFGQDTSIVLFSEDYSRELSSSILWLNDKGLDIRAFRMSAYDLDGRTLIDFQQIIPLKEAEEFQIRLRAKQQVEQTARRERTAWNGEFYANYGGEAHRSWQEARKYGFISAGGGEWFTRTMRLLSPGDRVWVNRPGVGYLGVGIVAGSPVSLDALEVDTETGKRPYVDVSAAAAQLQRRERENPQVAEHFIPIKWVSTVDESSAIKEAGFFGNQNTVAKPVTEAWTSTVERLKRAFDVE